MTWVDLWPTVSLISWIGTPLLLMIETAVWRPSSACQWPRPAFLVIQGDSGGPVMTIAGSSLVNAAGMIQADLEAWQGSGCGAVYDAVDNWCSPTVFFEPFSNVLSSFSSLDPTLDTG